MSEKRLFSQLDLPIIFEGSSGGQRAQGQIDKEEFANGCSFVTASEIEFRSSYRHAKKRSEQIYCCQAGHFVVLLNQGPLSVLYTVLSFEKNSDFFCESRFLTLCPGISALRQKVTAALVDF